MELSNSPIVRSHQAGRFVGKKPSVSRGTTKVSLLVTCGCGRYRQTEFASLQGAIEHAVETDASSVMVELPHREPHLGEFYARLGFHRDEAI